MSVTQDWYIDLTCTLTSPIDPDTALTITEHLAAAYDNGFFADLVTPFKGLTRDNNLRADSSAVNSVSSWRCQKVVVAAEVMVMPRSASCSIQSIVEAPS